MSTDPQGYPLVAYERISDGQVMFQIMSDGSIVLNTGVTISSGSGSPNGVVTAPVGSLYTDKNGVAPNILYQKQTGSDNTGWVAVLNGVFPGNVSATSFLATSNGSTSAPAYSLNSNTDGLIYDLASAGIGIIHSGSELVLINDIQFQLAHGVPITWSATAAGGGVANDTGISRVSADVVGIGNGTQGDTSGGLQCKSLTVNGVPINFGEIIATRMCLYGN